MKTIRDLSDDEVKALGDKFIDGVFVVVIPYSKTTFSPYMGMSMNYYYIDITKKDYERELSIRFSPLGLALKGK